jgi:hypothetical protein
MVAIGTDDELAVGNDELGGLLVVGGGELESFVVAWGGGGRLFVGRCCFARSA